MEFDVAVEVVLPFVPPVTYRALVRLALRVVPHVTLDAALIGWRQTAYRALEPLTIGRVDADSDDALVDIWKGRQKVQNVNHTVVTKFLKIYSILCILTTSMEWYDIW